MAQWRCKLGTKCKCWECSTHHTCLRFRSDLWQDIPDISMSEKEILQHRSKRYCCEILEKWTMVVSSKTWAGSATNMWTRCPRHAWPRSSFIIKHYRVQVGNHHWGYFHRVTGTFLWTHLMRFKCWLFLEVFWGYWKFLNSNFIWI